MTLLRALILAAMLGPGSAGSAQTAISPAEFEALATGRTLWFRDESGAFGAEQYLSGRRSLWRYGDGSCIAGVWWDEDERVCFRYEGGGEPQCWRFVRDGDEIVATFVGPDGAEGAALRLDRIEADPLPCAGPKVGT